MRRRVGKDVNDLAVGQPCGKERQPVHSDARLPFVAAQAQRNGRFDQRVSLVPEELQEKIRCLGFAEHEEGERATEAFRESTIILSRSGFHGVAQADFHLEEVDG